MDKSIDLNTRCSEGWPAFIYACRYGHKDVVKLILDHSLSNGNIDIGAKTSQGESATRFANLYEHRDIQKLLKDHAYYVVKS